MPAGPTYDFIASGTLQSSTSSISITNIPSTYTDLIIITVGSTTSDAIAQCYRFNNDTGNNYYDGYVYADTTGFGRGIHNATSRTFGTVVATGETTNIMHLQNYSNTSTGKPFLIQGSHQGSITASFAGYWSSTSAVNRVDVYLNNDANLNAGFKISIYGIKAA